MLKSLVSFFILVSVASALAANVNSGSATNAGLCQALADLYSQCGEKPVDYDGQSFHFATAAQPILCDDGQDLGFYDRIDNMDMSSIFMFPYQPGITTLPETRLDWDPGRLRSEDLFKSVYGVDESASRAGLVRVPFLKQTVLFQKKLGAAAALAEVSRELLLASAHDPSLARFLRPFTSKQVDLRDYVYDWRKIKGSNRLSAHAFGTAIDLLLDDGPQYWLWDELKTNPAKANQGENAYRNDHFIPSAAPIFHPTAVAIFEKNGFIWGGKWNHYDTMHFEYRPEMLGLTSLNCQRDAGGDPAPARELFSPPFPEDFLFIQNRTMTRPE
jgi:hypothetical protein